MDEIIQTDKKQTNDSWPLDIQREISLENKKINNMRNAQLKELTREYELSSKGTIKILRSRLKSYIKRQKLDLLESYKYKSTEHRYLVIIDFEATCNEENNLPRQEIIEFPAILYDSEERKIVKEFHSYVRPIVNETLTNFCTKLTGIEQKDTDTALLFSEVMSNFEKWLKNNGLNGNEPNFTIVTDGSSDISWYLLKQCEISEIELPKWGEKWINIKKTFGNFYQYSRATIAEMLSYANMPFKGRLHRGIDDARNITRLVTLLLNDGAYLIANECLIKDTAYLNGYTLSNIIKKDNEIVIEKKIFNEKNKMFKNEKIFKLNTEEFPLLL